MAKGEIPIWTNKWYLGYPIGLYYGFFYYLITGAASSVTSVSPLIITKICLVVLHAGSGLAFFRLAFLCCNNLAAALFASLFYVYSFQHIGIIVLAGALPLGLIFLLIPLLFSELEHVYNNPGNNIFYPSTRAAVWSSCLLFTHIQYGIYTIVCFSLVAFIRLIITSSGQDKSYAWVINKFLCLTGALTMILSAWYLVPLIFEKQYLLLSSQDTLRTLIGNFSWREAAHGIKRIMIPSRQMSWTHFYFGLVPLSFSLVGLLGQAFLRKKVDYRFASYAIVLVLTLPMAICTRYINLWFFLACLMSTWGVKTFLNSYVLEKSPYFIKNNAAFILCGLLLFDCGIMLVQRSNNSLPTYDINEMNEMASQDGRLAVLYNTRGTLWRSLDVIATGRTSIFGGIPQCSTKTHPYVAAVCCKAAIELLDNNGDISNLSRNAFRTLNVSHLIIPARKRILIFEDSTPALFAKRATPGHLEYTRLEAETWETVRPKFENRSLDYSVTDEIVGRMELHNKKPIAEEIILHPSIPPRVISRLNGRVDNNTKIVEFSILESHESHTSFELDYDSSEEGIIQLSYSYFPYLNTKIDGKPVEKYKSALGLLVLPVPAGRHTVSVVASISPLRAWLLIIAVAGIIAITFLSYVYTRSIKDTLKSNYTR